MKQASTPEAGGANTQESSHSDWPKTVATKVESTVLALRSKTVDPLFTIVKWAAIGLVGAGVGAVVMVFFAVALVRLLTDYLFSDHVWITYLVLGGINTMVGMFLWTRRRKS